MEAIGSNRKIILHMGLEKTGSTTIQHVLDRNRDRLREDGIRFPECAGSHINHTYLTAYAQDDDVFDNIKAHVLSHQRQDIRQFRKSFETNLAGELSAGPSWHTLILSTELIHSRITTPREISRLHAFLSRFASEIKVVMFIRRQDELAVSRYSTAVRAGYDEFDNVFGNISSHAYYDLPAERRIDDYRDYYDYRNVIQRIADTFGMDAIKVVLYPHSFTDTGLVPYFASLIEADPARLMNVDMNLNNAMSAEAQYVMAAANRFARTWKPNGARNLLLKQLHGEIETAFPGTPRQVPRPDAENFAARFFASNEWVRKTFFPERDTLFAQCFGQYPEDVDYTYLAEKLEDRVAEFAEKARRLDRLSVPFHRRLLDRFLRKPAHA